MDKLYGAVYDRAISHSNFTQNIRGGTMQDGGPPKFEAAIVLKNLKKQLRNSAQTNVHEGILAAICGIFVGQRQWTYPPK